MNTIPVHYDGATVISTSGLTKAFSNVVAVNNLHLRVMRGDVFAFLGPNGSGKTTTIRMLLGLIHPFQAHIAKSSRGPSIDQR